MAPATELPGNIIFYLLLVGAAAFFVYSVWIRLRVILQGKRVNRLDHISQRLLSVVTFVLGQARIARRRYWYSGALHVMIFWGFLTLQVRTLNFLLDGFHEDASLQSLLGDIYTFYRPVMDAFNALVIVGVGLAAYQRLFVKPPRLSLNFDAWIILGLIFVLMVTDVFNNSAEIALARGGQDYVSFIAFGLANLWDRVGFEGSGLEAFHTVFWYSHLMDFLVFLCYLPYSKHSHILTVVVNVFSRNLQPTGVLQPIADFETAERFGAAYTRDLSWKQLLDAYTCTECGRCQINCPAFLTGKALSPKVVVHDVRRALEAQVPPLLPIASAGSEGDGEKTLIDYVGYGPLWDCLTCGACMEECPVFIEHVPTILDMRRYLVMDEARMPETAQATLMQLEQRGHPWRGTQLTRTSWMEGMDVPLFDGSQEYLYWVGCTGALVERNVEVTRAVVKLLREGGVSFGVLGAEEGCSGDPARRLGNEYLFQMQAQQNIEVFQAKGVKKIVVNCPHCFNTFKNEYPQLGGQFEVVHHTELLAQLIAQGRLRPRQGLAERITIHDSCYIARHNGIVDAPRQVLKTVPSADLAEMERRGLNTFCCGAGGGHMWVEESQGQRINHERTRQAADTGAQIVATACPFCMQMFEDGVRAVPQAAEKGMKVLDVAELLEVAVVVPTPASQRANPNGEEA